MHKGLSLFLLTASIFLFSCTKTAFENSKVLTTVTLKIKLVSGGGQTDTVGNALTNPIVLMVTANDVPLAGYTVQFKNFGCTQDPLPSAMSQKGGLVSYTWGLSGIAGQQTLTAYVVDSDNHRVDSVKVQATALAAGSGWHSAGCTFQTGLSPVAFSKLSNGRLFVCYSGGKASLMYSDDNGADWNAVTALGSNHEIDYLAASATDELYAFAMDGVFYSKDAGQSWSKAAALPFNSNTITAAIVTRSGRIMVTSTATLPLCISIDKGKTWSTVANSAFAEQQPIAPYFYCPAEDKNGNLYVTDAYNANIFESADGGATWNMTNFIPGQQVYPGLYYAFYIDPNNTFYTSNIGYGGPYIGVSDDGMYFSGYVILNKKMGNMSLQSDGNFYYEDAYGLYMRNSYYTDWTMFRFNDTGFQPYIVAKNNNLVVGYSQDGYLRYHTN